jgi:tetratricopeptide (TPR) repeat protein
VSLYHEDLDLLPADAVTDLAVVYGQLGVIYGDAGDLDRAVQHYRKSIQFKERSGNLYSASANRFNVAIDLFNAGRRADALEYAQAALRGFESYGERAEEEIERLAG